MKFKKIYSLGLIAAAMCTVLVTSCKKDNSASALQPSRAFVPTGITTTATGAQVKIDWKASLFSGGTGITYTVDLSKTADFAAIAYTKTTDAVTLTLTDEQLAVGQPYYVRIKANATATTPGSAAYVATTSSFTMPGILQSVTNADLTSKTVNLKWLSAPDVTKITITPTAGGSPFDVALTPADVTAMSKLVSGLTVNTSYRADIFAGTRVKGFTTFTTPLYTREITTADNLVDVVASAVNGDVIGLADGTYDIKDVTAAFATLTIQQKSITLQGKSGDPAKVKVRVKQIDLKGTGAAFGAKNITIDGADAQGAYFLNLIGNGSEGENSTFGNITIDGSVVSNFANAFLRGNRGTNNGGFQLGTISVNNSTVFNINAGTTLGFNTIELSKVAFTKLSITNSTFYEFGRALVVATTALPGGTAIPEIVLDKNTFNSFGGNNMYVLVDANTNFLKVTATNNIIANTVKTTGQGFFRGTGAGSSYTFTNNATYALTNGAGGTLPVSNAATTVQASANITATDINWTATTTNFNLPAGSALRTASTTGGAIGDPRWAK